MGDFIPYMERAHLALSGAVRATSRVQRTRVQRRLKGKGGGSACLTRYPPTRVKVVLFHGARPPFSVGVNSCLRG